ncbi:hypothetical protein [Flavivirga algicola]|uniref:Uncharacterized protein n=1 Tax=Flavivirga algicola TaxID=2729136 RepID=A0ABX1S0I3_9FLAO|nr:hypothetical protein [Flavivirga algicola]NMH88866.1 hypothetical protein [Flavivirga algicola]
MIHIPFSLGVAVGRNHNIELALAYHAYPSVEQFNGAFAFGLSFPLN